MKIIIFILILILGCNVNDETNTKKHDIKNVKPIKRSTELTIKDTIHIEDNRHLIGQISTVISKASNNGNLYLYDRRNHLFLEYNRTGKLINIVGKNGTGPGEYLNPSNIYIDEKNYKYIFDTAKFTTIVFDNHDKFIREYKYSIGFPFPGELKIDSSYKIITLTNMGVNRYKEVEYFHFLNNKFKIVKSLKIDYPDIYNRYDLMNLTTPIWDANKKNIFITFPATNSIYIYNLNANLTTVWKLNSHFFKSINKKLDITLSAIKKKKFFSSYSLSSFLKIFKKNYIFYAYQIGALQNNENINKRPYEGTYYFHILTINGEDLYLHKNKLPGPVIDVTENGFLYLLINDNPYKPMIGAYKIEIK